MAESSVLTVEQTWRRRPSFRSVKPKPTLPARAHSEPKDTERRLWGQTDVLGVHTTMILRRATSISSHSLTPITPNGMICFLNTSRIFTGGYEDHATVFSSLVLFFLILQITHLPLYSRQFQSKCNVVFRSGRYHHCRILVK